MTSSDPGVSPLRRRMVDDLRMRKFAPRTQTAYLRAVRQFRQEAIPQEVIDALLDVARWSGSASNRQHWELVVVRKHETLEALARCEGHAQGAQGFYRALPHRWWGLEAAQIHHRALRARDPSSGPCGGAEGVRSQT